MKKFLCLLGLLMLYACSSKEEIEMWDEQSFSSGISAYITIPDTCQEVSIQTVKNMACLFSGNQDKTRSTENIVRNIEPVVSSEGNPMLYIVNFQNGKGFVIISATKNYMPILAYSDTGCFDIAHIGETGVASWLEEQKAVIAFADQLPDSIKMAYRAMWTDYNVRQEKISIEQQSRSTEDVYRLIANSVNQWVSEGYTVYRLSEYKNTDEFRNLPQNVQNQLINMSLGYANPNYGGREEVSFVLKKNAETRTYGPLLQCNWGQMNGYNQFTPNQWPAGCVAVAMGQIMKYHQSPSGYNWNVMANNYATSETARLLADIGTSVHMVYAPTSSGSTINNAYNAFKNDYGYTDVKLVNYDGEIVMEQIKNNNPVYMRGVDVNNGGHAWVCDGYQTTISAFDYIKLMTLQDCPVGYEPQMFTNPYTYPNEPSPSTVYHMNWGWEGQCNGYYTIPNPDGNNFSSDRKILIDLYP